MTSSKLTGALPAIDGSNLTGITSVGGATGVDFNDNVKARFGTGNDLEIYHNGTNTYMDNNTGAFFMRNNGSLVFEDLSGNNMMRAIDGGAADLYHDGSSKLTTSATGVTITGGVSLGGTDAAHTLDDYEEGYHTTTWTMGGGGTTTLNSSQNALAYTKIGRLVTVTGEINVSSVSSPSGSPRMSLPFAIASNANDRDAHFGSSPVTYSVPYSVKNPPIVLGNASNSYVNLYYMTDDGAFANYDPAAGETFFFSFSYVTS